MAVARNIVILLIEDSATVRTLYKKTFEDAGFEVIEAEYGQMGLKLAIEEKPDIIVLDMLLPDIHGLEVLESIRANEGTKQIPVLALTSLREVQDIQKAINLGANYYSVKGSDSPQKLLDMIYKLLKRSFSGAAQTESDEADKPDQKTQIDENDIEFLVS
ncbi:MAG TPA: response regulator [bacterium]|nr:response regulator [bacterium]